MEINSQKLQELVSEGPVVFYDGVCGLCDRTVKVIIRLDKKGILRFAPLQGGTAREVLGIKEGETEFGSVVLADSKGVFVRSVAVINAMIYAGGAGKLAYAGKIFPAFIRDAVYALIAKNRYRIFGKADECLIPAPALKKRFLP